MTFYVIVLYFQITILCWSKFEIISGTPESRWMAVNVCEILTKSAAICLRIMWLGWILAGWRLWIDPNRIIFKKIATDFVRFSRDIHDQPVTSRDFFILESHPKTFIVKLLLYFIIKHSISLLFSSIKTIQRKII